jgi:hypothetical protein
MDYINIDPNAGPTERTNISGVRVLDGEDQGIAHYKLINIIE